MAVPYPPDLPTEPQRNGFSVSQKNNVITSEVDIGEAKKRRRYTDPIMAQSWSMILTPTQKNSFINWFIVDLQSGVQRFDFTDPFSGVSSEFRINGMPTFAPYSSCGSYIVSFNVELLP